MGGAIGGVAGGTVTEGGQGRHQGRQGVGGKWWGGTLARERWRAKDYRIWGVIVIPVMRHVNVQSLYMALGNFPEQGSCSWKQASSTTNCIVIFPIMNVMPLCGIRKNKCQNRLGECILCLPRGHNITGVPGGKEYRIRTVQIYGARIAPYILLGLLIVLQGCILVLRRAWAYPAH